MVTYEHAKVTKMTVVFIARDSVDIFKVYGETVAVRFFLILVSLFYVEVSVTRPVFHIWYCTRGFLFRLKIVLPPS